MTVDNWKFWIVPCAAWVTVMAWYAGYQSGYQEGHQTAWQMSHPSLRASESGEMILYQGDEPLAAVQ